MLRRDFLKALAMAAVAPTLMAQSGQAMAAVNPHQKYIDALVLFDNVIASKVHDDPAVSTPEMEKLFSFLMANFAKPSTDDTVFADQVKELLNGPPKKSLDSSLRHIPPKVAEIMWPVVAAKALLSEHKVRFTVRGLPSFIEFSDRYRYFIVQ
jgi:hypothetical protein